MHRTNMASVEWIADLFTTSQAEENLRKHPGKEAQSVQDHARHETRTAMEKFAGITPDEQPVPEEKEQLARLKAKSKKRKLMLDE